MFLQTQNHQLQIIVKLFLRRRKEAGLMGFSVSWKLEGLKLNPGQATALHNVNIPQLRILVFWVKLCFLPEAQVCDG